MKKLYLMLFLSPFLIGTSVFAQDQQQRPRMTVEERAKKVTEWMVKDLDLKKDQVAAIDSINLVFTKAQQVLFQSSEGVDREKLRDSMKALEQEKVKSLSQYLTPEQLAKYETDTENFKKTWRRGGK